MPIATKSSKLDISIESDAANFAKKFATFLKKGDVVLFYGEIGVGKTTFIKNLINNLQKKNNLQVTEIPSPTFNLVNEYEIKNLVIQHYDLFRLKDASEIKSIGLLENLSDTLTLVEWPEKIKDELKDKIDLYFEYDKNLEKRYLIIKGLNNKLK